MTTPTETDAKSLFDLIPDRKIRLPLSWLITGVLGIISLSVAYGGYKAGYQTQISEINEAKQEIKALRADLTGLTEQMIKLSTSLDDLKASIERSPRR